MDVVILDTDILSELMKQHDPTVKVRAESYFRSHQQIAFSAITCYQILRWLRQPHQLDRLTQFERLLSEQVVLEINISILQRAADLWIEARSTGRPREDVDLIIAATALNHDLTLVTANTRHFDGIAGLRLDNWRKL
jgi:tRNA(fMet)-specific endonuclease VapC